MMKKEIETFCPESQTQWRKWLRENHLEKQSVWLICYTKKSNLPTVSWNEAVDDALCFGWIDSTRKSIDEFSFMQLFTKRKTYSTWSKINKEKIKQLTENGLMTAAGLDIIEIAKQNGSWIILDDVEDLKIPQDLEKAFESQKHSKIYFLNLSKTVRKAMLFSLVAAKKPETRQKRIDEIVAKTTRNIKTE